MTIHYTTSDGSPMTIWDRDVEIEDVHTRTRRRFRERRCLHCGDPALRPRSLMCETCFAQGWWRCGRCTTLFLRAPAPVGAKRPGQCISCTRDSWQSYDDARGKEAVKARKDAAYARAKAQPGYLARQAARQREKRNPLGGGMVVDARRISLAILAAREELAVNGDRFAVLFGRTRRWGESRTSEARAIRKKYLARFIGEDQ